jgi:cation:H+ antiporter
LLLVIAAAAAAALIKGADALVDGASGMAYRMGISKVIVGATIVSIGTTTPECAVSVLAAWSGEPGFALGNAVGSIIVDSGLIFGLGCLITVLPSDRFVRSRQGWVQFGSGVLLAVICYLAYVVQGDEAEIGRGIGLFLLALLVVYMVVSVRWSRRHPAGEPFQIHDDADAERKSHQPGLRLIGLTLIGIVTVLLGSRVLFCAVNEVAENHWHVPKVVIAGTIVAISTSLPELVIGMASILKGHKELLVGNVIGADILNVLFVIGASAAAAPLGVVEEGSKIPEIFLYLHLPTMLVVLIMFRLFIFRASATGHFRRWFGLPLVLLYAAYAALQFILSLW